MCAGAKDLMRLSWFIAHLFLYLDSHILDFHGENFDDWIGDKSDYLHDVQRFLINELMFGFNYVDAVAMTYHCCPVVEHSFETKPLKHSIDKFVVNTSIWNSYATAMYTFQEKTSKYGKSNVNIDIAYLHNNTTHTSTAQNSCLTCSILVTHV